MPRRAMVPCPGRCGGLVETGYCEGCRARGRGAAVRKSSNERGYGAAWQRARRGFLRKHPFCADPYGVHGERTVAATDVDHRRPHRGNQALFWESANWQGLCKSCHSRKTATEDGGFGR